MRKTKAGSLLIEIKGDKDEVEAVRAEVSRTVGSGVEVRSLQPRTLLEIRDLDQWTVAEEVAEAVIAATGTSHDTVKVISLRKGFGGSQTALVLASAAPCEGVVAHGRLRVGMVNCRVRLGEQNTRCFRCLSFGHRSGECKGPDRSSCCWRCGKEGHLAATCHAPKEDGISSEKS